MKGDLTSESEEEWKEGSNDEFEAEIEPDVVPKKRNTYQDQKTALLETDDEEEDTEEIRERRRREKRNLHDLIMEQLNKEEVVDPRVFVPDQTAYMSHCDPECVILFFIFHGLQCKSRIP